MTPISLHNIYRVLHYYVAHTIIRHMVNDTLTTQILEMRRGSIVLALLSQLGTPHYGYDMLQQLESAGFTVDAGTLYPLLRRLESQGVLESTWNTSGARPRKYYQISAEGKQFYASLKDEWQKITKTLTTMTEE